MDGAVHEVRNETGFPKLLTYYDVETVSENRLLHALRALAGHSPPKDRSIPVK